MRNFWIVIVAAIRLFGESPAVVRAGGDATVTVRPEQTLVRLLVTTTASNANGAAARNATRSAAVIARLKEVLGPDVEVRTATYAVNRQYLEGFTATNSLEVHVPKPMSAGKAIDAAVKAGATVAGLDASAPEAQEARTEVLRLATSQARANAEAMAAALGMRVVRLLTAETSAAPVPLLSAVAKAGKTRDGHAPETTIETGPVEIRAHVTVTLEVAR